MSPPTTMSQRSGETCSFMTKRAKAVSTKGVSMTMAVNSATGMRCKQ
jgi:hypothetical protein